MNSYTTKEVPMLGATCPLRNHQPALLMHEDEEGSGTGP